MTMQIEDIPSSLRDAVQGALAAVEGRFTVRGLVGAGAFSAVFQAVDRGTGVERVLKITPYRAGIPEGYVEHLVATTEALPQGTPGLLLALEAITTEHGLIQVFESLPSARDLTSFSQDHPLRPDEVFEVVAQLADALCVMHKAGVLHADVKPQNILVASTDPLRVVLSDFGWATRTREDEVLILGTYEYLHPALRQGLSMDTDPHRVSIRAALGSYIDIYSLGVVALKLLARSLGISSSVSRLDLNPNQIAAEVASGSVELAGGISRFLVRCLEVEPSAAMDLACDLGIDARLLSTGFAERSLVQRPRRQESAELERIGAAALRVFEATAAIIVELGGASVVSAQPDFDELSALLQDFTRRGRRTWIAAVSMTVTAFVLTVGLIVTAVVIGMTTGSDGWTIAFGSGGAALGVGTLLWRPFDRVYRAHILSTQIELIAMRAVTALRSGNDPDGQRQVFDEALAQLGSVFERHGAPDEKGK